MCSRLLAEAALIQRGTTDVLGVGAVRSGRLKKCLDRMQQSLCRRRRGSAMETTEAVVEVVAAARTAIVVGAFAEAS